MPNFPSVFISYNPYSEVEQTLAIRLHTIGSVNGLNMLLPDRSYKTTVVTSETRNRIMLCDFFILFSTTTMSNVVQQEISIAYNKLLDKSKILVIYDQRIGKNLKTAANHTEVFIDTQDDPLKSVTLIANKIKNVHTKHQDTSFLPSLGSILMIGLGLFALNEIFNDDPPPRKRKATAKKKALKKRKPH